MVAEREQVFVGQETKRCQVFHGCGHADSRTGKIVAVGIVHVSIFLNGKQLVQYPKGVGMKIVVNEFLYDLRDGVTVISGGVR